MIEWNILVIGKILYGTFFFDKILDFLIGVGR